MKGGTVAKRKRTSFRSSESRHRAAYFRERVIASKLANAKAAGTLIDLARVQRDQFALARAIRDRLMNLPTRLAPELVGLTQAEIELRIEDAIREALNVPCNAMGNDGEPA